MNTHIEPTYVIFKGTNILKNGSGKNKEEEVDKYVLHGNHGVLDDSLAGSL